MKTLTHSALSVAATQVGVREIALGNRGPKVDEYIRRTGLRPPCSWCACFVYWCIDEAAVELDVPNPFHRTGFCPYIDHWARQEGILHASPAPGDVFLLYGDRAHHTGFVVSATGSQVETIEGNTNNNGSSNGDGVYRRVRRLGDSIRFVRWESLVAEEVPLLWSLWINTTKVGDLLMRNNRTFAPVHRWAQMLGFTAVWDDGAHAFKIGGKTLDTQVVTAGNVPFAAVRDLAELAGLKLAVDGAARRITAYR